MKTTSLYRIVVKSGKYKNKIIEEGYAATRNEFIEKNKQTLIDCGLYQEAAGIVFKKNFYVKKLS